MVRYDDARKGTTKLRVVDPYEDEGIWAIANEGANSNTQSDHWKKDAYLKDATTTNLSALVRRQAVTTTRSRVDFTRTKVI